MFNYNCENIDLLVKLGYNKIGLWISEFICIHKKFYYFEQNATSDNFAIYKSQKNNIPYFPYETFSTLNI